MDITYSSWPDLNRATDVTVVASNQRTMRKRVQPLSQSIDFRYQGTAPAERSADPRVYTRSGMVQQGEQQPTGTLLDAYA